jgi:hypothetical protein
MFRKLLLFATLLLSANVLRAQDTFYDVDSIQQIEIFFSATNWDAILDANVASETYYEADMVIINGVSYTGVGVKYKGNSSYNPTRTKNPFHLKLDYIVNQNYQGYKDIKLGNGFSDASFIREVSSYSVLRNYMDAPRCNYAKVYINGNFHGLYTNSQDIGNSFLENHYYSSCGAFVKCNPVNAGPGSTGSSLLYISPDSTQYYNSYEVQSDYGWRELLDFCDTLNNHISDLNSILDIDRALWMLAFNNVLVNLDSYSGAFKQNYYLYRNHQQQWIPTVWDVNMSYGGFTMSGLSQLTLSQMQTMTPELHLNDAGWPLIKNLLSNPLYKRMYLAHMRTLNSENFLSADYKNLIGQLRAAIDPIVQTDVNFLYTYTQFQNALTTATGSGMGSAPIYGLMDARATYLSNNTLLNSPSPVISNVTTVPVAPNYLDPVTITATVTNATPTTVWMGFRDTKSDRFERVLMYDDGMHGDSAAGDNIYGVSIYASSLRIQYYLYAENTTSGIFSPERAEHEFYTLYPNISMAGGQDIILNELMASNSSIIANEECKFRDWIEIYNTTNQPLGLGNLYLSDDPADLQKWGFPRSSIIQSNEYLLIWADDNDNTWLDLHTNFNLAITGDVIYLSDSLGTILDSVSFTTQSQNIAYARCPDITGNFYFTAVPTPRAANICSFVGLDEGISGDRITVYPNPAADRVTVSAVRSMELIRVTDLTGKSVYSEVLSGETEFVLDLSTLAQGVYFVQVDGSRPIKLVRR